MKAVLRLVAVSSLIAPALATGIASADCPFTVEAPTQITRAGGKSETGRANQRCIWVAPAGTVHLVWEDDRDGNLEIYYTSVTSQGRSPETRITKSQEESSFPCIAGEGDNVYILWQETVSKTPQLCYLRMAAGKEAVRKQITQTAMGAYCPVAAVGSDGALHIAYHRGAGNATSIHYGKIVADSLVGRFEICTKHLSAFRPDIACDVAGRLLIVWYEGLDVKSRLYDGAAWQEETLVATNLNRSWRLSASNISPGRWVAAWFDQGSNVNDVWAMFFDGKRWYDKVRLNPGQMGFYPTTACYGPNKAIVAWESQDKHRDSTDYLLMMRCFDGKTWGAPAEIARGPGMSRYASLAPAGDMIHAIWFSSLMGNYEIFYTKLVSR